MDKEVVIIMGYPAAGKSTLVNQYVSQGYHRMNRDDRGGSLSGLNKELEALMRQPEPLFVLDNTYATRESRKAVIDIAKTHGYSVRCVWLTTKLEDAQYNASYRLIKKFVLNDSGTKYSVTKALGPDFPSIARDPICVPSIAQYAYKKRFEKPTLDEGFSKIEEIVFVRNKLPPEYKNKAIILDYDGTLRKTKNGDKYPTEPSNIEILPGRTAVLKRYAADGYKLLGVSNQSGIEKGDLDGELAYDCFDQTNMLLGLDIDYVFCPHHSFPIRCYCRKPLPGLGVYLIEKHLLDPAQCIMVGDSTSDKTFSQRVGFLYCSQEGFFK